MRASFRQGSAGHQRCRGCNSRPNLVHPHASAERQTVLTINYVETDRHDYQLATMKRQTVMTNHMAATNAHPPRLPYVRRQLLSRRARTNSLPRHAVSSHLRHIVSSHLDAASVKCQLLAPPLHRATPPPPILVFGCCADKAGPRRAHVAFDPESTHVSVMGSAGLVQLTGITSVGLKV